MPVTSNALFHYTLSLKNLTGILNEKFKVAYCREQYDLSGHIVDAYYPMVSFCDIPLSQAKNHIDSYGSYGIGMSKDWGIKHRLNPVTYIERDSFLAKDIKFTFNKAITTLTTLTDISTGKKQMKEINSEKLDSLFEELRPLIDFKGDGQTAGKLIGLIMIEFMTESLRSVGVTDALSGVASFSTAHTNLFRYIKNYQGDLVRRSKVIKNYRFYDEREWRYVPDIHSKKANRSLTEDEYAQYRKGKSTKPFIEDLEIPFTGDDIKYLIVKSNKDIPKLLETIRNTGGLLQKATDADILATKIFTVQQLSEDF